MTSKDLFANYLKRFDLYSQDIIQKFEVLFEDLKEANSRVNLFSRKMSLDDIWAFHFLDCISLIEVYKDFAVKKILDFGTGGGLPGVPVKLLFPDCEMTLLDSTKKKIECIKGFKAINDMKLDFISERLENLTDNKYKKRFDIILCRSVKITKEIKKAFDSVLNKNGKIFLYKAIVLDDVEIFNKYKIHKLSPQDYGERRIVEINYG